MNKNHVYFVLYSQVLVLYFTIPQTQPGRYHPALKFSQFFFFLQNMPSLPTAYS